MGDTRLVTSQNAIRDGNIMAPRLDSMEAVVARNATCQYHVRGTPHEVETVLIALLRRRVRHGYVARGILSEASPCVDDVADDAVSGDVRYPDTATVSDTDRF